MANRIKTIEKIKYYQGLTSLKCLDFPDERKEFHETMESVLEIIEDLALDLGDSKDRVKRLIRDHETWKKREEARTW